MKPIVTSEVYEENYCKRIAAKEWRYTTIPNVVKVLYDHFKPESVIDIGCANGLHLKAFKDLGVKRLFGIEGTIHWAKHIEYNFGKDYIIADLREDMNNSLRPFDLVISFEVLEHLEPQFADQAVKNILSFGSVFCLSACPIKGGFHHFNPQPREYWIEKFESQGAKYCKEESESLQNIFKTINCSGWFKDSLKVFRK